MPMPESKELADFHIRDDVVDPLVYQERVAWWMSQGVSGTTEAGDFGSKVTFIASSKGRGILYIDPGLGKSRIAIECATRLPIHITPHFSKADFILILCSKKALNTWRREWAKWTDVDARKVVIVEGQPAQRAKLWQRWKAGGRIFVVTFQSGLIDYNANRLPPELAKKIKMVIADECKVWINRKTKNFEGWKSFMQKVEYFIPMDGTLVKKGPQDLWTFYTMLKPKMFTSYWRWVNTFCNVVEGPFGREIAGPKNTKGFGQLMAHTLIRLRDTDDEVKGARPPLTRDFKLVEMTPEQQSLYDNLTNDLFTMTPSGQLIVAPSVLALATRQRQLLICPKILDENLGNGAALEHLILEMEDDPHVVIFTPFTKAIPYISAAIKANGGPEPYILQGGATSKEVRYVEEGFNRDTAQSRNRACICSVSFAESFELYTAKQCFFLGYDWMQIKNYQAEKRLQRLITPHPIISWYYRYMGTVDDQILDKLNENVYNVKITFQDYMQALRKDSNDTND